MNTPFNQTSYTAELIANQQARTIRDVLANDPSVRVIQAAGGGADSLFIRGFYYDSGDFALNGLAGIAPYYSTGANFIERVEVLKGPERRAQRHDDRRHRCYERRRGRRHRQSHHQARA